MQCDEFAGESRFCPYQLGYQPPTRHRPRLLLPHLDRPVCLVSCRVPTVDTMRLTCTRRDHLLPVRTRLYPRHGLLVRLRRRWIERFRLFIPSARTEVRRAPRTHSHSHQGRSTPTTSLVHRQP